LRTKNTPCSRPIPGIHPFTSRKLAGCGQFVSASIIVPPLWRMVRTLFGFGLVITASMTESFLAAAGDSNEAPMQGNACFQNIAYYTSPHGNNC
jgi:hypothetical protein